MRPPAPPPHHPPALTPAVDCNARACRLDWGGTSDPFVVVTVGGQSQQTEVVKQVRSAQFDSTFTFEIDVRHPSDLELQSCQIKVVDANAFPLPDKLIGSYELELARVYLAPGHEVWNTWFALANWERTVNGFVRASVVVLAPGDEPSAHPEAEGDADDEDVSLAQTMVPADVALEEWQLTLQVERAEGLPSVDGLAQLTGAQGVNPYLRASFGVAGDVRTEVASPATRAPVWAETLLLPLELPALANTIRVEVLDHDYGRADTLLGSVRLSLAEVRAGAHAELRWHTLYGPSRAMDAETAALMARGVLPGSAYCGRVLLAATASRVAPKHRPQKSRPGKGRRRADEAQPEAPAEATQRLRLEAFEGFGLPNAGTVRIGASLGNARALSHAVDLERSQLRQAGSTGAFLCALTTEAERLPEDPAQSPDAFVELWDVPATRLQTPLLLYYARLPAAELLVAGAPPVRWVQLTAGPGVSRGAASAWVQVRLALQRGKAAREPRPADAVLYRLPTARYTLRAIVYLARFLPASAGQTAPDAYVLLRGGAPALHTTSRSKTAFPQFFETMVGAVTLCADPRLAAPLSLLVLERDNVLAFLDLPVAQFLRSSADTAPLRPSWHALTPVRSPRIRQSEQAPSILASFELWPYSPSEQLPPPPPAPRQLDAVLSLAVVALRGPLAPVGGLPVVNPLIRFSVSALGDAPRCVETRPSSKPSGAAPSYFTTLRLPLRCPEERTYAPALRVDVVDNRPLGMRPLVGSTSLPLDEFVGWAAAPVKARSSSRRSVPRPPPAEVRIDMVPPPTGASTAGLEAWRKGRCVVDGELEDSFPPPFREWPLLQNGRTVGRLKGLISLRAAGDDAAADDPLAALGSLATPQDYVVRVYAIRTRGLLPAPELAGRDMAPYLRMRLASKTVDTKREALRGASEPEFRACLELRAQLPGAPDLVLEVLSDGGALGRDTLLGRTVIDLEDRLFNREWRALALDRSPPMAPLESRMLHLPGASGGRGRIELLVELLPAALARATPLLQVALPPPERFVMRLVVWGTKAIPLADSVADHLTHANDLFVRATLEGMPPDAHGAPGGRVARLMHETDTHWRVRHGEGSFNWRCVFPLELPWRGARLALQVWDHDVLTPNDHICEGTLNVEGLLTRALTRFRASGGAGSGAVEHFPDPSKTPKAVGAPGTNEHLDKLPACGFFNSIFSAGSAAFQHTQGLLAEKGKGQGEWIQLVDAKVRLQLCFCLETH